MNIYILYPGNYHFLEMTAFFNLKFCNENKKRLLKVKLYLKETTIEKNLCMVVKTHLVSIQMLDI